MIEYVKMPILSSHIDIRYYLRCEMEMRRLEVEQFLLEQLGRKWAGCIYFFV